MTKITPRDVNYDNKKPNTEPFEKRHGAGAGRDQIPPPPPPSNLKRTYHQVSQRLLDEII
jgi:hypothetical protein